jgi:hypothetical protein
MLCLHSNAAKSKFLGVLQSIERTIPRVVPMVVVSGRTKSSVSWLDTKRSNRFDEIASRRSCFDVRTSFGGRSFSTTESGTIFEVGAANFMDVVMKSPEPVILDCYAEWY